MIIIYNLPGLVIGALGVLLGLMVAAITGLISLGVLTIAIAWIALGLWWRNKESQGGLKRSYPALFFIPLPFLGIPLALLAFAVFFVEAFGDKREGGRPDDPIAAMFQADERTLNEGHFGGDVALSEKIHGALATAAIDPKEVSNYHVFARVKPGSVLVLVKAPDLRKYKDPDRVRLLHAVDDVLSADDQFKGKPAYIGIKGRVAFGAIQTPPESIKLGNVLSDSLLYGFYGGDQASPKPAEVTAPSPVVPEGEADASAK